MLRTNKVRSPWISRLGYTYLRLRDNHMEILNKDDEIERLVVDTGFDFGQQSSKKQLSMFLILLYR